jgi:DNA-binding LytR/AlgR family response regulator
MIKYIIVDDEVAAHNNIQDYASNLSNLKLLKNCYNAFEAISFLNANNVDLIFLDINMPKLSGFDFLKTLVNPPHVIVCSAYAEFAIDGYAFNITDYLLKPFSFERFLSAINKVNTIEKQSEKLLIQNDDTKNERIFLKDSKKHYQIKLKDILFLEAFGNYVKVFLNDKTITTHQTLSHFNSVLSKNEFVQVHKSFIIATEHINLIEGNIIHIENHKIPISKTYKLNVNQLLKGS